MKRYAAILVFEGKVRRITFEAADELEAQRICEKMGTGFDGEAAGGEEQLVREAFPENEARFLLGDISPATLYRWLAVGKLSRVPGTSRLLVTRSSIEKLCSGR